MIATEIKRWAHQTNGLNDITTSLAAGTPSLCFASPTGGGKSLVIADTVQWAVERGMDVAIYTNRKLLLENLIGKFSEYGTDFGVRAAGYESWESESSPVQLCSIQTQHARTHRRRKKAMEEDKYKFVLPHADLVIRDEAHIRDYLEVTDEHRQNGAQYLGTTATPLDISDQFDELIVAGTKAELFGYKPPALRPTHVSAIAEFDTSKVKRNKEGEYIINKRVRELWTSHIVGFVREEYLSQTEDEPFMGFAYGVAESKHHCKDFCDNGIPCAHIDGDNVYVDGTEYKSDREAVADVFDRVRGGSLKGVWNRFKLREGIDLPFISTLLLACPIGSLLSYIQVVGRLLRYHPDVEEHRILDFGGNWWKHPSPNSDIDFHECWKIPVRALSGAREMGIRDKSLDPGYPCPKCGECYKRRPDECSRCGTNLRKKTPIRRVVEHDGTLREVQGFPKNRPTKQLDGTQRLWDQSFWSAKKNKPERTFGQCWAWFVKQHWDKYHCQPPRDLPLMPKEYLDWFRAVGEVPMDQLVEKGTP
jgi:DNA repair protein RadD